MMRGFWSILIVVLLLGGCAGQTLVYNTQLSPAYRPTAYGYGAGRRDLTTVIHGDPFPGSEQQVQARFVELLNRHQPMLQPTNFTLTPGPSARPLYRAVYLLNYAHAIPDHICREPFRVPPADLGPTVRVTAAFCQRQSSLSTVTGEVAVDRIDDPRFDSLIGQINLLLFPPVDPSEDKGKRWIFASAQ
jgi:hypothetical protein